MGESGPSIFSLIINGEMPCHKVYEDEHVISFLDVNPFSPGHTLVVPKEAAETLDALSEESAQAIGCVLPRISRAVLEVSGASEFNVLQNNGVAAHQEVMHVHFHVIPRNEGDAFGFNWPSGSYESGRMEELAEAIRKGL